eukprot:CAMPEP_0170273640 /NCGR_PEP_ID=MMETSP0116_2-20130129/36786_1 /TAXON_ID=400756 /ORGANISM="Durinskia baltica, Strain CSIRO CS-38" /LENGTH=66 /DNA_ID=CAMNT_0010524875 /DNA_START=138 /DNA_END=337 /DNA_ORIENTATION=-
MGALGTLDVTGGDTGTDKARECVDEVDRRDCRLSPVVGREAGGAPGSPANRRAISTSGEGTPAAWS